MTSLEFAHASSPRGRSRRPFTQPPDFATEPKRLVLRGSIHESFRVPVPGEAKGAFALPEGSAGSTVVDVMWGEHRSPAISVLLRRHVLPELATMSAELCTAALEAQTPHGACVAAEPPRHESFSGAQGTAKSRSLPTACPSLCHLSRGLSEKVQGEMTPASLKCCPCVRQRVGKEPEAVYLQPELMPDLFFVCIRADRQRIMKVLSQPATKSNTPDQGAST